MGGIIEKCWSKQTLTGNTSTCCLVANSRRMCNWMKAVNPPLKVKLHITHDGTTCGRTVGGVAHVVFIVFTISILRLFDVIVQAAIYRVHVYMLGDR